MSALEDKESRTFEKRTPKSKAVYEKAKNDVPYGVHSNYRFSDPYPLYFSRAKGTRLWDVDGNEYTDYNMGFGVLVAGHAHPLVVKAIKEQAAKGTDFGFEWEETPKFARMICERFGVDQLKLANTGAEATMYATRFARSYTKRDKIIKFEGCYHGGNETLIVSVKPSQAKEGRS